MITAERAREILNYDPETGQFTRKLACRGHAQGEVAGALTPQGYLVITADGRSYRAHRLAFLWMTGAFPNAQVDHINRVKGDNRWVNLRECTASQNKANQSAHKDNQSGFKGIYFCRRHSRWYARLMVAGKQLSVGSSKHPEIAAKMYLSAAAKYFGEFASA